jgi:hypothetical protein
MQRQNSSLSPRVEVHGCDPGRRDEGAVQRLGSLRFL